MPFSIEAILAVGMSLLLILLIWCPQYPKKKPVMVRINKSHDWVAQYFPCGIFLHQGHSWYQAHVNMGGVYAMLDLTIVCGSVAVGHQPPFFVYGGPAYFSVNDFKRSDGSWNAHCWLEDKEGYVFDIFTPYMEDMAARHKKRTAFCARSIISGCCKADLKRLGLVYIPAPKATQRTICKAMELVYS